MPPSDAEGNPHLDLAQLPPTPDIFAISADQAPSPPCRPLLIYTRPQLLHLQSSPLVKPPPTMPELKHWFGEHEPSQSKKDSEPSTPNSARERRFRRDAEDGETSSRPSFRSALSQPSQMGNFKHQSENGTSETRKARKGSETQLSDKYDRDRLAAPGLRNKERDIAPHLALEAAARSSAQLSTTTRRGERERDRDREREPRDGSKKKVGESSEDWRRGTNRQDRSNREDTEGGRPRARDSSRPRRDPSSSRRDRDDDKDDARRTRDDRRPRDDHRRERGDRDADRDDDPDDSRRWRDDGKRDERMAARRAAERQAASDKTAHENGDASGDKRWTVVEERDGRIKRNHRDRRAGADEVKEKPDRRDRDKEKEPAWMDTYVPESSGATGILGGKAANGELDGIQAWKKGIKEKEQAAAAASIPTKKQLAEAPVEKPMDEIQLFRLMMEREKDKKSAESSTTPDAIAPPPGIPAKSALSQTSKPTDNIVVPDPPPPPSAAPVHDANSLLSILGKVEPALRSSPLSPISNASDQTPASSRFFPKPINSQNPPTSITDKAPLPVTEPPPTQFNPPAGSRVLAFGSRTKPSPLNGLAQPEPTSSLLPSATALSPELSHNQAPVKTEPLRSGFSPFDDPAVDALRRNERAAFGLPSDGYSDSYDPGYAPGKGPRFAKFFDSKPRETSAIQSPVGFTSSSPNPLQRDVGYTPMDHRAIDGLLSKLNNSAQIQRSNAISPNSAPSSNSIPFGQQAQHNLQLLQQQQQHQHAQQQHQLQLNNRLDSLYDSRLDDRFVPDGMVPGLRSAPPPRSRDNGMYSDGLVDDNLHFNQPRLPPQHHRGLDPMYNPVYSQQGGRNAGIPIQPQFRGAPSPISSAQTQRLPAGLANLGGRPPLEGSQFIGMPGLGLHPNGPPQQQFGNGNSFGGVNGNYGSQMRGMPPQGNLHQLGHGNMDLRSANNQILGLGGRGGIGFGGQQGQMQQPLQHALRQQQEQQLLQQQQQQQQQRQLPPHMLGHHLQAPPQTQGNGQADLMALLMGAHRE
ncbi:hypothetical protein MKEN_00779200 [Mycena kentingensis (nom. inval.)]|nr:hypothetical protein MKEN_00779200 [Mycena kentingensis (nom. inval.)]